MAIFVPGMKCPLCHPPIARDQATRLFPPFVTDANDPFFVFHDVTVHQDCFLRDARRATRRQLNRWERAAMRSWTLVDIEVASA
jgi:hypothetical protein